jgi:methylamine---glutamate N-methyltransferase subunit B
VNASIEIRLSQIPAGQLRHAIAASLQSTSAHPHVQSEESLVQVNVREARGQHYVGVGLAHLHRVNIDGSVGDYALCGSDQCECNIDGNANDFLGHSLRSGVVIATGNAGHAVGAMGTGGLIAIYGSAGDRAGVSMRGSDVLIRGNAGSNVALGMRAGTIVIGGSAGEQMGHGMRGGTIYLRGDAPAISRDIEEQRLREPDRLKLGLLLLKAGIKATAGKDFRVFRPKVDS